MAQTYEIDIKRFNGQDYDTLLPTPAAHAATHQADGSDPIVLQTGNYGDNTIISAKIVNGAVSTTYTASVLANNWTGGAAPYTNSVSVSGILSTDNPIIDIIASEIFSEAEAQTEAWAYIYKIVTSNNNLTFYATDIPTVDLPVQIKAVRK